jgi:hypothetical protein
MSIPEMTPPPVETPQTMSDEQLLAAAAFKVPFEKIPSNWSIEPREDDEIYARNRVTYREFEGSIELFNALMRA